MAEANTNDGGEREAMQLVERERVDGDVGQRGRSKVVEEEREAEEEAEEEVRDGNAITRFWTRQVALRVRHEECRDHFGACGFPLCVLPGRGFMSTLARRGRWMARRGAWGVWV